MPSVDAYLTEDEETELYWTAESVSHDGVGNSNSQWEFAATDRRIVFTDGEGSFQEIGTSHIRSIESEKSTDVSVWDVLAMGGLIIGGLSIIGGLVELFSGTMTGISVLVFLFWGIVTPLSWKYLRDNDEEEKFQVRCEYGDDDNAHFTMTTKEDITPKLSRIVRGEG